MPVVARDLHAVREYGFVFSIFLTLNLLGVVVSGAWGDARGPAGPTRAGLLLFGGGLVLCGVATDLPLLLLGRALAGFGGGLLVVGMYVVIARVYPSAMQPRVFALVSTAWVLPSIVGPALAGWLAQDVTWRAVFLLVPPLTVPPALALLPRLAHLAPDPDGEPALSAGSPRLRLLAGAGLAVGVSGLQWGLDRVGRPDGARLAVPALVCLLAFGLVALTLPRLLPPGALRLARGLPTVVVLRGLFAASYFGVETFVPLMLVTQRGLTPTEAGLALTGGAIGWTCGSVLQGRPGMRVPRHVLLLAGGIVVGLSQWLLVASIRPPVPGWTAVPIWALAAFGVGISMSSTSVLTLRLSAAGQEGRNSASLQVSDSVGSALGIGAAGAAFAAWHDPAGHDAGLFTAMWLALGGVAVLAGLAGLRVRVRDAAPARVAVKPVEPAGPALPH